MPDRSSHLPSSPEVSKIETDLSPHDELRDLDSEPDDIRTQSVAHQIEELIGKQPQKEEIQRLAARIVRTTEFYSGVIPHPRHLREYNEILPGAADRLLSMAEREQETQIAATKTNMSIALNAQVAEAGLRRLGMHYGFAALVIILLSSILTAKFISIALGGTILGLGVSGIIGKFIYDRYSSSE